MMGWFKKKAPSVEEAMQNPMQNLDEFYKAILKRDDGLIGCWGGPMTPEQMEAARIKREREDAEYDARREGEIRSIILLTATNKFEAMMKRGTRTPSQCVSSDEFAGAVLDALKNEGVVEL